MSKYDRTVYYFDPSGRPHPVTIDVYDVLKAFDVTCPAVAHAAKKLLCAGLRGKGDRLQDLTEAVQAVERAVELERERLQVSPGAGESGGAA